MSLASGIRHIPEITPPDLFAGNDFGSTFPGETRESLRLIRGLPTIGDNPRQHANTSGVIYSHAQYVPVRLPPPHMCPVGPHVLAVDMLALLHAPFSKKCAALFLAVGAESLSFVYAHYRARLLVDLVSTAVYSPTFSGEDGVRPGARHLDVSIRQRNIVAGA